MSENGINYFAVSNLDEALNVRKIVDTPILCLEPIPFEYLNLCIENNITITLSNYDDYLKMSQDDIKSKLSNNSSDCKIVCLTTNELFNSYKKASEYFGISYQVLYNSINYGTGITSKNNKLNKKLTWCKYENAPNNCRLQEVV